MEVRNSHIAHSDLRLERAYTGIELVEDLNYGKRPNAILQAIFARRNVPHSDTLLKLSEHCVLIVEHYLIPQLSKVAREIREQILKLPSPQFEALPDYFADISSSDLPEDSKWHIKPADPQGTSS